ncbi:MAG: DsbE family thiol:disulfide interchange protein [Alphaproteobacteria bacterium]
MTRLLFIVPLLVFAGLAGWIAVPLLSGSDPRALPSTLIDRPAPEFALPALPGDPAGLALADLRGEVVLVNFFASWCVPCLAEHPLLTRLSREQGIRLYGVNYKDEADDARSWLDRHGNPYDRIGADRDGRVAIDWGVYGVPETFVVDAAGRIRFRHAGPLTPAQVETVLLPLIEALRR